MENRKPDIERIRKYLNGELNAREMYELERQAEADPLLMDLMLGMESAPEQQHKENLATIETLLKVRTAKKSAYQDSWKVWVAAASIVLVSMGIGFWLLNQGVRQQEEQFVQEVPLRQLDTVRDLAQDTDRMIAENVSPEVTAEDLPIIVEGLKQAPDDTNSKEAVQPRSGLLASRQPKIDDSGSKPAAAHTEKTLSSPQVRVAKGVVTDKQTNIPLMGAAVKQAGRQQGTTTDARGSFELPVPVDSTGVDISYIGYEQQRVDVAKGDSLVIAMEPSKDELNEVVVEHRSMKREDSFALFSNAHDTLQELLVGGDSNQLHQTKALPAIGWRAYQAYLDRTAVSSTGSQVVVTLAFRIDEQGKPINIRVLEEANEALDRHAIKILQEGSLWIKGKDDQPDEVRLTIRFR